MLTSDIAQEIVNETMTRLHRNINIMNASGIIIASGDRSRINQFHEGALEVIQTRKPLLITKKDKMQWQGTLAGINLPIEFQGKLVGVIGITGEPDEVEEFGELVKMTTELMIRQSFLASQSEWKQTFVTMIIEEWIKPAPNWTFIDQRLDLLQLQIHPPYQIIIIDMKERNIQNQALIDRVTKIVGESNGLVGFLNANKLLFLSTGLSETKRISNLSLLKDALQLSKIKFTIGVGGKVDKRETTYISYQEAELALLIESREGEVTFYSDIEVQALVYQLDEDIKRRYVNRVFPNMTHKQIETLKAFFSCNLNITETAKILYIHRNTLIYRLRKIKEETGYDPFVFNKAVPLQLAVWILEREVPRK
ncbi:helix-turn-helix domain-containing protein [Paenibacillus filicis]|uniref:Helix-turn-helix domain-containing protein n=1 Tax=Paenibacillus gyeongsangnamensis TaxID=3388067 RepID=A0ABT4Q4D8_9BACL|nr:sugar diacid recognition domain-containing protein [Paenibacillus filicis]MCZ8511744.1 helix-turn-helix domain-containing protein [Paenibacillus filicis]